MRINKESRKQFESYKLNALGKYVGFIIGADTQIMLGSRISSITETNTVLSASVLAF